MQPSVHSSADLIVKVFYVADSTEKAIGFGSDLQYSVTQGQKPIFTVDSPFPVEIAQAAAPSMVRGTLTLYLPKGSTPESSGLIPYRVDQSGQIHMAASKLMHLRLYDRNTSGLVMSIQFMKSGAYTVNASAKGIVQVRLEFEGMYLVPGNTT